MGVSTLITVSINGPARQTLFVMGHLLGEVATEIQSTTHSSQLGELVDLVQVGVVGNLQVVVDGFEKGEGNVLQVVVVGNGKSTVDSGQVGGSKATSSAPKKNAGGFGSVGPVKAAAEGELSESTIHQEPLAKNMFVHCSSDLQLFNYFGHCINNHDANSHTPKRDYEDQKLCSLQNHSNENLANMVHGW